MGFLDSLRRALGADALPSERERRLQLAEAWGLDTPGGDATDAGPADPAQIAASPDTTGYDREIWRKKLRLMFTDKMPVAEREWTEFLAEAQALGFDRDWVEKAQREEFEMMVRRAVADGVVTLEEHHNLELARSLIGIPETEAEDTLHRVVDEARAIFGKEIEGA
jgi:hypothetical protein